MQPPNDASSEPLRQAVVHEVDRGLVPTIVAIHVGVWVALGINYLVRGSFKLLAIAGATAALSAALHALSRNERRAIAALHGSLTVATISIVCISMLTGQSSSQVPYFLGILTFSLAFTASPAVITTWTAVTIVADLFIHASQRFVQLTPELPTSDSQRAFQQVVFFVILGAANALLRQHRLQRLGEAEQREEALRDMSERLQSRTAELEQARDRALDATRAKSAFLANMSHELRTPLNAVIGMASLLADERLTVSQREQVNTIRTSSDALLGLISDILDLSKIEAGKLELSTSPFNLSRCIEDALELVAPQAQEKSLELYHEIEPGVPGTIVGDFGRLRQVLVNLLANAVKFTSKGEVSLVVKARELSLSAYELTFEVRDTGIGIPEDRIGKLFHAFEQGDSSMTREFGGSGLGLAISKALVEKMGGGIGVESAVGRGSTFRFTIKTTESKAGERASGSFAVSNLMKRRVLIACESQGLRASLARLVSRWGSVPIEAPSPDAALRLACEKEPHVCLLDARLGGGLPLAARLRAQHGCEDLPIVLLTPLGYREQIATDEEQRRIITQHVAAQVSRPIKPNKLHDAVKQALEGPITPSKVQERPSLSTERKLKVLVAEDNVTNQRVAARMLERLGHDAVFVSNGQEALDKIARTRFDVALLDVQMPVLDGLETARRIVSTYGRGVRPRLIAMTASALAGDRERCLAAGMDSYLSKPVDLDSLAAQLTGVKRNEVTRSTLTSALDPKAIENLKLLGEQLGAPVLQETITLFLEELPTHVDELRKAMGGGDLPGLGARAHTLKGASAAAGALELSTLSFELEQAGKRAELDKARAAFERLDRVVASAERALRDVLARATPAGPARLT